MCFYIHPNHPKAKVAKRDIVCYKQGFHSNFHSKEGWFVPWFQMYYEYKLGERQPRVHLMPLTRSTLPDWLNPGTVILEGYHSYSNKKCLCWDMPACVKCIIPKGTEYYYNPDAREYVSETIIVQEFI